MCSRVSGSTGFVKRLLDEDFSKVTVFFPLRGAAHDKFVAWAQHVAWTPLWDIVAWTQLLG